MTNLYRPTNPEASLPQQIPSVTQPWHLPELSLYITDSCSLSCSGCISFNNYALGSHLELSEQVEQRISAWAQTVSVDRLYIIGGEPLSHPDLEGWMQFAEQSWPKSRWTLVTNGRGLESRSQAVALWLERGWDIEISSHSKKDFEEAQTWWATMTAELAEPVVARRLRDQHGITDYWEDTAGSAMMQIGLRDQFYAPTHTVTESGQLAWNKLTPPRTTHSLCDARDCTHLVNGIMYRCPVQATAPRLSARYEILGDAGKIAAKDLGYDPLKPSMSLSRWMASLNQPTDQCRLCEWPRDQRPLGDPTAKKIKLVRRDSPATALEHPASPADGAVTPTANNQA